MQLHRPAIATVAGVLIAASSATALFSATPAGARARHLHSVRLNSFESALLTDMNQARTSRGLSPLTIEAGATDVARRWSRQLAKQQYLEHNPHLLNALQRAGSADWHAIRENVGEGPEASPEELFQAYMHSPEHKANILAKDVHYIGVGVVQRGQTAWNTVDFVDEYSNHYGVPRVPADAIQSDTKVVAKPQLIAAPTPADQRFGAAATGRAHSSVIKVAHGVARAHFQGSNGKAAIVFRQALTLVGAGQLTFRLAATDKHHRAIPVAVSIGDNWSSHQLATVRAGKAQTVTVNIPLADRANLSALQLTIGRPGLRAGGHHVTLSLSQLRATN